MSVAGDGDVLVLDCGTATCKAGFAEDRFPSVEFPTIVGLRRGDNMCRVAGSTQSRQWFVGNEVQLHRNIIENLRYPIEFSTVSNWDLMEKIFYYIFHHELHVDPEKHPVLLTERAIVPRYHREKMTQIMFETFDVPAMYSTYQEVLALFACGRTTGLCVDSGAGATRAVPVYEGHALPYAIFRFNISGLDLTHYLWKMLVDQRGYSFMASKNHLAVVRDIKEKLCYVAFDFEQELRKSPPEEIDYKLPNGQVIAIGNERFLCPEALFDPFVMGQEGIGIHELCSNSVRRYPDIQDELLRNIVLSGGSAKFPGMAERFHREMGTLFPNEHPTSIKVITPPSQKYAAWMGGSLLASVPNFQKMCIAKREYDETGPSVIHRKCF